MISTLFLLSTEGKQSAPMIYDTAGQYVKGNVRFRMMPKPIFKHWHDKQWSHSNNDRLLMTHPPHSKPLILSRYVLLASLMLMPSVSQASVQFSDCQHMFYGAIEPDYIEPKLTKNTYPLCFNGFAVMYSGVSRTPLWSAEALTRDRLYQADELPRNDSFHQEMRLPAYARASLDDYSGSGYDRGHLSPNADMADLSQQYDSFHLANIVPQSPHNNRYVWRELESTTRYLTKKYGEVYVVTGVAFSGDTVKQLNAQVLVPSHLFKALYIPSINQAGVYYAPNDESGRVEVISIDDLALRSGIDVMPAVEPYVKANAYDLPLPGEEKNDGWFETSDWAWWAILLKEVALWIITQLRSS